MAEESYIASLGLECLRTLPLSKQGVFNMEARISLQIMLTPEAPYILPLQNQVPKRVFQGTFAPLPPPRSPPPTPRSPSLPWFTLYPGSRGLIPTCYLARYRLECDEGTKNRILSSVIMHHTISSNSRVVLCARGFREERPGPSESTCLEMRWQKERGLEFEHHTLNP